MKILTQSIDHRIQAINVMVEISMKEYLEIAESIINENEFQRKKVINSQISKILREDITIGCSVPPLVLALKQDLLTTEFNYLNYLDNSIIEKAFDEKKLLILDGKQRTHVFLKLHKDLKELIRKDGSERVKAENDLKSFLNNTLRIEVYVGINKLNILYRMLTLNSGQTNMSTRHLMEMLYLDYLDIDFDGIRLVPDKNDEVISKDPSEFIFKDILDGFTSYLDKDENTLERSEILDNIKSANNIKQEVSDKNIFENFVITYKSFIDKMVENFQDISIVKEELIDTEYEIKGPVFGKSAIEIFKRSQAISGFGAAIAELKDIRDNFDLEKVRDSIKKIHCKDIDYLTSALTLNKHFDNIRDKSKKIGNDQRFYFKSFFRSLFDPEASYTLCFDKSIEYAYKKTREEKSYLKDLYN
ncbi:MAG: hypothetical protein LBJ04_17735 [Sphingobacterium sp.]|jgi:hypothetical protein|nr:hypothetical protein [Sphingobacterium sp.]